MHHQLVMLVSPKHLENDCDNTMVRFLQELGKHTNIVHGNMLALFLDFPMVLWLCSLNGNGSTQRKLEY